MYFPSRFNASSLEYKYLIRYKFSLRQHRCEFYISQISLDINFVGTFLNYFINLLAIENIKLKIVTDIKLWISRTQLTTDVTNTILK